MKKLLVATANPAKIKMFRDMLNWIDINLIFLSNLDYPIESPVEDWDTIESNALLKAKYYSEITWYPTLADDAGFAIEELNWEPWIMWRRWWWLLPDSISDEDWLEFYLNKTKHLSWEFLHWSFPFARCLYLPSWEHYFQSDKVTFTLERTPRRPYKAWWPVSSMRVFSDWRHEMDIPYNDPVWEQNLKKNDLYKLLENL